MITHDCSNSMTALLESLSVLLESIDLYRFEMSIRSTRKEVRPWPDRVLRPWPYINMKLLWLDYPSFCMMFCL